MNRQRKILCLSLFFLFIFVASLGNPFANLESPNVIGDEFEGLRVALQILATGNLTQQSYYFPLWSWIQIPFVVLAVSFAKLFYGLSIETIREQVILNPGILLPVSRVLSSILSTIAVVWVFLLGKNVFKSGRIGLFAAVFFSVSFTRFQLAHFGRVSSLYLFFILASLYYILSFRRDNSLKRLSLAILFITLATGAYQPGICLFLLIPFIVYRRKGYKQIVKNLLFLSTLVASAIFLIVQYELSAGRTSQILLTYFQISSLARLLERVLFYFRSLLLYESTAVIFGLAGLFLIFKTHRQNFWGLTLFSLLLTLPYLLFNTVSPRYILAYTPVLAIGNAVLLNSLWHKDKILTWFLFLLITGPALILDYRFDYLQFQPTTNRRVSYWIEENIKADDLTLMSADNLGFVPFPNSLAFVNHFDSNYHRQQKNLLLAKSIKSKKIKNIQFLADMKQIVPSKSLTVYFERTNYKYLVLGYSSPDEKRKLLTEIPYRKLDPIVSFTPALNSHTSLDQLDMQDPWEMFAIDSFGLNYSVYLIKQSNKM